MGVSCCTSRPGERPREWLPASSTGSSRAHRCTMQVLQACSQNVPIKSHMIETETCSNTEHSSSIYHSTQSDKAQQQAGFRRLRSADQKISKSTNMGSLDTPTAACCHRRGIQARMTQQSHANRHTRAVQQIQRLYWYPRPPLSKLSLATM